MKDKKAAFKRLITQSDPQSYQGDMIAATVESIEKNYGGLKKDCKPEEIDEDVLSELSKMFFPSYGGGDN